MKVAIFTLDPCNDVSVGMFERDARKSLCRMNAFDIYKKCMYALDKPSEKNPSP